MTRRRLLLVAGAVLTVWALLVAVRLVQVASDLRAGRDAAEEARDQLGAAEVADREPLPELRTAAARFERAGDRAGGLVLLPLRFAPVVGRQLRSVRALSASAGEVAAIGTDAVDRAARVFEEPAGGGHQRVEQVRELVEIIETVAARLAAIDDLGPHEALVSPLADARNQLAADLADARRTLDDARVGARAALELIEGPRRYLVVAANNAEMRAGSGMWLQGGALVTDDGDLTLDDMVSLALDADPPDGVVVPTGDLAARWGFLNPGNEWRNLMASPRFPESAALAMQMWEAARGEEVDGVLAVDAIGLQAIIAATGPVDVDGRTIDADAVPVHVLHDQYLELGDLDTRENAERREKLAVLARSAVDAIDAGGWSASTMIESLADAIAGRHLLAWSPDADAQRGWATAGMSGELERDSLLVSLLNRGGNKLDWFVDVDAELSVERRREVWEVAVEITMTNAVPAGEPTYVAGPHPALDTEAGEYRGLLAVNVPGDATRSRFDDVDVLAVAGSDGPTRVVGFELDLAPGERRAATLRFELPRAVEQLEVLPSARVPPITWRYGSRTWEDSGPHVAKWSGDRKRLP